MSLYEREKGDLIQGHWEEEHVKTEADTGGTSHCQDRRVPRVVGSSWNLEERHGIDPSTETPERTNPAETFIVYFWHLEL